MGLNQLNMDEKATRAKAWWAQSYRACGILPWQPVSETIIRVYARFAVFSSGGKGGFFVAGQERAMVVTVPRLIRWMLYYARYP